MMTCPELEAWKDQYMRLSPGFVELFRRAVTDCQWQAPPEHLSGRGVITCADGVRYGPLALRLARRLRDVGWSLPIECWRLPEDQRDGAIDASLAALGVTFHEAEPLALRDRGWALKAVAVRDSELADVLFLDADNWPVRDPLPLFEAALRGAMFWPVDERTLPEQWKQFGLPYRDAPLWETGQFRIDKRRHWPTVLIAAWLNGHADEVYKATNGDPMTWEIAFQATASAATVCPVARRHPWGLEHFGQDGRPLFEHRCWAKDRAALLSPGPIR